VNAALTHEDDQLAPEVPPGGRDLLENWIDVRYLETFSGFGGFCFQIATDSDCRARSGEGIMEDRGRRIEDRGWRMEDGGWREKRIV
jgi:hypothetical protein